MGCPQLAVIETKKSGKKKAAGHLKVMTANVFKQHTFLDYIRGGAHNDAWELNMVVGIDFTGSNGNPAQPGTLHYCNLQGGGGAPPNPYEQTITGLASVLEQYDSDQQLPCYGFGARGPDRKVSHCFPLTGNPQNPYVHGVQGVLDAYHTALTQWGLSGPTNFAQIIGAAASMSQRHVQQGKKTYTILLIITDGAITDMQATKNAIVAAAALPVSILIVGVGNEQFDAMTELDGDEGQGLHNSRGEKTPRDIVQFVRFNDFASAAPGRLAKEALHELPGQMMKYFKSHNIEPPAVQAHAQQVSGGGGGGGAAAQVIEVSAEEQAMGALGAQVLAAHIA